MNKINELITNYKNIFLLIIFVIIVLAFCKFVLPYFMTNKENKENLDNVSANDISKLIDQNVYIKCNLEELNADKTKITNTYYLSISQKKKCANLQNIIDNECQFNIPILLKQKTAFGLFEFSKHPSLDKYTIRSKKNELNSPNLTQNLNFYRNKNLLCFDNDKDEDIIYFEVTEVATGYLLNFKKPIVGEQEKYQDYYVGVCTDFDPTCNQGPDKFKRICLYLEQSKATVFQFEMQPKQEQEQESNLFEHKHEHKQEQESAFEHKQEQEQEYVQEHESFKSMGSIYSFLSTDSDNTLLSLPGAGNIEDANMEDFKPWIED